MKRTEYKHEKAVNSGKSDDTLQRIKVRKTHRNEPCPCGKKDDNGRLKKFKHCCLTPG